MPVEIWFQDEMRIGQKNGLIYQWAKKGTCPRRLKDQRYANAVGFGAICPARDLATALVLPRAVRKAQLLEGAANRCSSRSTAKRSLTTVLSSNHRYRTTPSMAQSGPASHGSHHLFPLGPAGQTFADRDPRG
jgi:hypothetical protein